MCLDTEQDICNMHSLEISLMSSIYVALATILGICLIFGWSAALKKIVLLPWKQWYSSIPGPAPSIISPFQKVNFFGRKMSEKYGPIYKFWHHITPVLVLGDPEAIRTFYKDHFAHKREADLTSAGCIFKEMMGECLGVTHGRENVKSYRGHFEPFFSSSAVKRLQPLIGRAAETWVTSLDSKTEVNLYECSMTDIAFKVLSAMCYGEETMWRHLDDIKSIFRLHSDAMSHTTASYIDLPLWSKFSGIHKKADKFNEVWREFHDKLLQERKDGVLECCDGLFFALWDSMQAGDCALTEKQLFQTLDEILLFNVDISQAATAFLIADIARYKEVQQSVLEEINHTLGSLDVALVDDLSTRLPYLHTVMKESARMWPALALTFPERTVKVVTEIGGHFIPKDTAVCIDPYTVNYNPIYWPEPETFDPERFSGAAKQPVNQNAFFRFGLGPRKCLGYRVALATISITTVKLLQSYELGLAENNPQNEIKRQGMSFFTPYLAPNIVLKNRY